MRLSQSESIIDPRKTAMVARKIVEAKIRAEEHTPADRKMFAAMLAGARSTDDIRHVEAKAAQVWWRQWERFGLSFKGVAVVAEWRSWPGRYSAGARAG